VASYLTALILARNNHSISPTSAKNVGVLHLRRMLQRSMVQYHYILIWQGSHRIGASFIVGELNLDNRWRKYFNYSPHLVPHHALLRDIAKHRYFRE
jgi:hypothetical protein